MRSDASIATSAPVPIAIPRSASASAGASLTPSPTIATTRPSACSRRTTSAFSAGSTSAMTSSMPTRLGDRARGRLVVAGHEDRAQAELAQPPHGLRRARLGLVGDDEQRARRAVPAADDRRQALGLGLRRARAVRARRAATARLGVERAGSPARARAVRRERRGDERRPPGDDLVAVDDAAHAEPALAGEAAHARRARPARAAALAIARAIGCSEACSSAPTSAQRPRLVLALGDDDAPQRHPPLRERAGLVEHDRVDAARGLEDLRPLDEQPELRAAPGADEQRGRRREPERARAGDDQHGDGGRERDAGLAGADPEARASRRRSR